MTSHKKIILFLPYTLEVLTPKIVNNGQNCKVEVTIKADIHYQHFYS